MDLYVILTNSWFYHLTTNGESEGDLESVGDLESEGLHESEFEDFHKFGSNCESILTVTTEVTSSIITDVNVKTTVRVKTSTGGEVTASTDVTTNEDTTVTTTTTTNTRVTDDTKVIVTSKVIINTRISTNPVTVRTIVTSTTTMTVRIILLKNTVMTVKLSQNTSRIKRHPLTPEIRPWTIERTVGKLRKVQDRGRRLFLYERKGETTLLSLSIHNCSCSIHGSLKD